MTIKEIHALRDSGDDQGYLAAAQQFARENPNDVSAQIEGAYASDSVGTEEDAIGYYDRAWELGVPAEIEKNFLVGYGSTLRNVGRTRESINLFDLAVERHPEFAPLFVFRALSLHADGQNDLAMSSACNAVLLAATGGIDRYQRSITFYAGELSKK